MKILDMLRGGWRTEQRAADPSWNALTGGGSNSAVGQHVDAKSAESISTVFGCVQALSESTACLPLHTYRRNDDGSRERVDGHWLSRLLDRPNDWQTGMEFREEATACVLLRGNSYSRKDIDGKGEVVSLVPLHPDRMTVVKLPSGKLRFDYSEERGNATKLLAEEVMHLRDRSEPGNPVARSRIAIARDTLGLSLALRAHGSGVFGRGARPAGIITNEGTRDLTTPELTAFQQRLENYASPANAGKTLLLLKGMKYQNAGLSNEDAEWLAAMQFGVTEVCRIFRVPPILVQTLEQASYNNVNEFGQQFVRFSLQRWLTMWEEGISRSLLGPIARQRFYAEHSVDALMRGNGEARAEFYAKALNNEPWMDVDEVRRLENLPQRHVANDATR
ncbi:phage portal protein [Cognatiluteimonas weifangensis]|nr:phage portal protein [Luteimonas weifangensis]